MARLGNDRNELYARHRAKGMIPSKAALAAGYAPGSSTTHLEQDAEVVTRISELMDEQKAQREAQRAAAIEAAKVVGQLTGVTRSWVIQKLAENAQMAAQDGQWKESNAALELIGKDFGMFAGGSADEDPGAVPDTFDMDKLGAMLDSAHNALPKAVETDESKIFEPGMALSLIEGQVARPRLAAEREFTTGSETDVALTVYGMPDEDEEDEAETD